jgi:hypothetical protein
VPAKARGIAPALVDRANAACQKSGQPGREDNDMATMNDIDACVFDAFGTLFDFAAAAARYKDELGDK